MFRTPITRAFWVVVALTAAASLVVAGVGQGKLLEKGTFREEFTDVAADFCDVPGLTVQSDIVVDGRFMVTTHGPGGLSYFKEHVKVSSVDTNLANGKFVTFKGNVTEKDLKVTDNGDGTLTILVLATGNAVLYGMNGKAIARNPGQVRFELLIDHSGTPTDPSDDEFLEFLGIVKESTGRSDDFCAASVAALS
jgi:hypothetical protein